MIAMWLPSFIASSRSWLTNTMVFFSVRCSSSSSSWRRLRISGSSAENGSSISRMSASVANARASPTRCCMPPDSSWAYLSRHWSRLTSLSFSATTWSRSAPRHAAQLQPEADVLGDRAPGQQRELLEHHRDPLGAQAPERRPVAAGDVDRAVRVVDQDLAAGHLVEAVDGAQQRRLAGAREPHQHADLARLDRDRGAGDADHLAGPLEDRLAIGALVEQRQRLVRLGAEDDVDVPERDLGPRCGRRLRAVAGHRLSHRCARRRAGCRSGRAGSRPARSRARPRSPGRC